MTCDVLPFLHSIPGFHTGLSMTADGAAGRGDVCQDSPAHSALYSPDGGSHLGSLQKHPASPSLNTQSKVIFPDGTDKLGTGFIIVFYLG